MDEVFPVLSGIVVGLVLTSTSSLRIRAWVLSVFSVVFGTLASWVAGELAISWVYLLVDVGQVFVVAVMTAVLVAACRRHVWQRIRQ